MKTKETENEVMSFNNEEDMDKRVREIRRSAYQSLTQQDNGSHNVVHGKNEIVESGQYMISHKFKVLKISEVISTWDHKGVFSDESKRTKVTNVRAIPVVFNLTEV